MARLQFRLQNLFMHGEKFNMFYARHIETKEIRFISEKKRNGFICYRCKFR